MARTKARLHKPIPLALLRLQARLQARKQATVRARPAVDLPRPAADAGAAPPSERAGVRSAARSPTVPCEM
jgi:hypothetical protein